MSVYIDPAEAGYGIIDEHEECKLCGGQVFYEDGEPAFLVCEDCIGEHSVKIEYMVRYLRSQERQEIGHTSWTDFVLRVLCGVDKLPQGYPLSLTDLIVTPDEINWNDDVIAMALEDYINEDDDSREDYHSWLKERLA